MNCLECKHSHITKKMVDYNEVIISKITCQNKELLKKHQCDILLIDEDANTLYCPYYQSSKDVKPIKSDITIKNTVSSPFVSVNSDQIPK